MIAWLSATALMSFLWDEQVLLIAHFDEMFYRLSYECVLQLT